MPKIAIHGIFLTPAPRPASDRRRHRAHRPSVHALRHAHARLARGRRRRGLASQPTLDKVLSSSPILPRPPWSSPDAARFRPWRPNAAFTPAPSSTPAVFARFAASSSFDVDVKEAATRCSLATHAESGPAPARRSVVAEDGAVLDALCLIAAAADAPLTLRAAVVRTFDACCRQGPGITRARDGDGRGGDRGVDSSRMRTCMSPPVPVSERARRRASARRARASAFACLASMARHADDLATMVMDVGALGDARAALTEDDVAFPEESAATREAAAALLREWLPSAELAEAVASDGGVDALVQCLALERGNARAR